MVGRNQVLSGDGKPARRYSANTVSKTGMRLLERHSWVSPERFRDFWDA